MNKLLTLFLCLGLLGSTASAAEPMPFYFFRLLPKKLPNILNKQEAQKRLCKFIPDHCVLPDEKEYNYPEEVIKRMRKIAPKFAMPKDLKLKYSVQPLYKNPDKKSEIVGVFVNAVSGMEHCQYGEEHCYESALASFVMNKDGTRRDIRHYASESYENIFKQSPSYFAVKIGAGESQNSFYAYIRAMDAIPNEPLSQHAKPKDHWYALANPDGKGGKLWFRYKSDLRTPKFARLASPRESGGKNDLYDSMRKIYGVKETEEKSFLVCRYLGSKVSIVHSAGRPFTDYNRMVRRHKKKSFKDFAQGNDICTSSAKAFSPQETSVELSEFYENGFFKDGFGLFGIEVTDFIEFQESFPVLGSYGYPVKSDKK